jgi:ornithine cyclodeaminase
MLILNQQEVIELLPMKECITVMRDALVALANGEVHQPLRTIIRPPGTNGLMGLMPVHKSGEEPVFGLKAICLVPGNPAIGKDAHQGTVLLFSGESGELMTMMNASAITALRTAAVSAVATDLLAQKEACDLAMIGAGVQARTHLDAMSCVRQIKRCRVVGRELEHARSFADEMSPRYSFPIEVAGSVQEALAGADLIVTVTNSVEPVVQREWISDGAHLNVVGSSTPNAREVDSATMADASLFVDRRESTLNEAGDYLFAARDCVIGPDDIRAELGEVITGVKQGRTSPEQITLFKSLGLATEDLFAAEYVFSKASQSGVGKWVPF